MKLDTRAQALRRKAIRDRIDTTGEDWAEAAAVIDAEREQDPEPAGPQGGGA